MSLKFIRLGLFVFIFGFVCFITGAVLTNLSIKVPDQLLLYIAGILVVGFFMMLMGVALRCYKVRKYKKLRHDFEDVGYCVIEGVLDDVEIAGLIKEVGVIVDHQDKGKVGKRKGAGYAIRDLLGESVKLQYFAGSEKLKK